MRLGFENSYRFLFDKLDHGCLKIVVQMFLFDNGFEIVGLIER